MIRQILFITACSLAACIVPESSAGNTAALKTKVEKDPSKYITDNGKGVAFVKCARDDSFFGGPTEMARNVVDGCEASLTAALARFPEILDVDPVLVEGTTAGYMVLYSTETNTTPPMPKVEPTSVPAASYNSGQ